MYVKECLGTCREARRAKGTQHTRAVQKRLAQVRRSVVLAEAGERTSTSSGECSRPNRRRG
eukprot:1572609-Pyramimonas_sp.AAC.1